MNHRAPNQIWLQVEESDVTWSDEPINKSDVEYVRKDSTEDYVRRMKSAARNLLLTRMVKVLRTHFGAVLLPGFEFKLWDTMKSVLESGPQMLGAQLISLSVARELHDLVDLVDGWWVGVGGANVRFVSLAKWRKIYESMENGKNEER